MKKESNFEELNKSRLSECEDLAKDREKRCDKRRNERQLLSELLMTGTKREQVRMNRKER